MSDLAFPGVKFGECKLDLPARMTFKQWSRLGEVLQRFERSAAWWIGEWAVYGEQHFGERYADAISEESGYAVETVRVAQWVAERVPPDRRRSDLSWAHHRAVAALEPDEQEAWLDKAASDNLTTRELYDAARPDKPKSTSRLDEALRLLRMLAYEDGVPIAWPTEASVRAVLE